MLFSRSHVQETLNLTINQTPLTIVSEHTFLGVIFDNKLSWKPHISYLVTSCKRALNLMKFLGRYNWGSDSAILLRIYQCLIRSRLDYGAIVYSTANKTTMNSINRIQHSAIRIALGAFITSPIQSLLTLANELPLEIRWKSQALNYAITVSTNPRHPNYTITFNRRFRTIYQRNPRTTPPLYERVNRVLSDQNIRLPQYQIKNINISPWSCFKPITNIALSVYKKSETPPRVIINHFSEIISTFQHSYFIYTDAAKTREGVGTAIYSTDFRLLFRLPQTCSTFTGELYAILQAVLKTQNFNHTSFVICTDSLSSIQLLRKVFPSNVLAQQITHEITRCQQLNKNITLMYVPSHIGILGNEEADMQAKLAITSNDAVAIDEHYLPSDFKNYIRLLFLDALEQKWRESNTHLSTIQPSIFTSMPIPKGRKNQMVIQRLRLGHSRLTHGYLITNSDPPSCDHCRERLTVTHILSECRKYSLQRQSCNVASDPAEALGKNPQNICNTIDYLKVIGLFYDI